MWLGQADLEAILGFLEDIDRLKRPEPYPIEVLDRLPALIPCDGVGYQEADLDAREREVVHLVAAGKTNAQIAAELWVTPVTVKKHLENVYEKLGVGSRAAAASRVESGSPGIIQ